MYRFTLPPVAVHVVDGKIIRREITAPPPPRPATVAELLARRRQLEQQTTAIVVDPKTRERTDLRELDQQIQALISKGAK